MMYYLNEDKTYRPVELEEWWMQFEHMDRKVADDTVYGYHVSTVWLGIDHNHTEGKPLLFETMVFDGVGYGSDVYMRRYSTWEEAKLGHQKAIDWVLSGCPDKVN